MQASPEVTYTERLWPGPLGWFLVAGFAVFVGIALLPVDPLAAGVAAAASAVVGVVVAVAGSTVVTLRDDELRVGRAHIPANLLGSGRVLDRAAVHVAVGPGSDARAFVCLRAWIPGGVELEVIDPDDPTPTWLISSRRPDALLAAVRAAARRDGQAAHSEQTI